MPTTTTTERYVALIVCAEIDPWGHNEVFASELRGAFATLGLDAVVIDYKQAPRDTLDAIQDPRCAFFVTFNGFGTELHVRRPERGHLLSAYQVYGKQVYDLMHDSPASLWMRHQMQSLATTRRVVLSTDYAYAAVASRLSGRGVRYVPSITFPATLPVAPIPIAERGVKVLIPTGLSAPGPLREAYVAGEGVRDAIRLRLFDLVVEEAIEDWEVDPGHALERAAHAAGIAYDLREEDDRVLFTSVSEFVKLTRRRRMLDAVRHLPVTVVTDVDLSAGYEDSALQFVPPRSFAALLQLMADTRLVLALNPHLHGWHERVLAGMSAGAGVVASRSHALDVVFRDQQDLVFCRSERELAALVGWLLEDLDALQAMADQGRARAMDRFSPVRLAESIVSLHGTYVDRPTALREAGTPEGGARTP